MEHGSVWACVLQKLNATMASVGEPIDTSCVHHVSACSQDDRRPARRRISNKARDPYAAVPDPLPWSTVELPPDSHVCAFRNKPTARPACVDWEISDIKRRCFLIRRLGEGTDGQVYAGKYTGEADHVAVKISGTQHLHKPIYATEIAILTRLRNHENVVRLRDFFFSPYFSVMVLQQLLDTDLWHVLNRFSDSSGLQPVVATHITGLVALGVAHVHSHDIIHRDLHGGNILLSFKGGLRAAIEGGLQPANLVDRVCIADFGQACDVHGSKRYEERSVGVGSYAITPPECYFAMKGLAKKKAMYDSAVDVWAIGVNLLMMIAGPKKIYTFNFNRSADYLGCWAAMIGKVPATVANRMGWVLEAGALRDNKTRYGLQPNAGLQPIAVAPLLRSSMTRKETAMCSLHHTMLEYDHTLRILSRDIHRRCEELTGLAASESGNA